MRMPVPLFIASRSLAYRRARSLVTILAVALGTSVVAATFATNQAIDDGLRASARALAGNADLVIDSLEPGGLPQDVLSVIRALPGVQLATPQVQKRTFFRTPRDRGFVEVIGIDPDQDPQIHPYRFAAGHFFGSQDERSVLLVNDWADREGLRVGGTLDLMTQQGFQPFTVVGLIEETDLSQKSFGGLVRVPLHVAQSTLGPQDRVALVSLKLRDPNQAELVKAQLAAAVPYLFVTRESPRILEDLLGSMRDFQAALLFFGVVALLAGAFLVFNTLSLTVAEQVREIGLLRAAGVTARAVIGAMLVQGLILGTIGGIVGVAVGQLIAVGLVTLIDLTQGVHTAAVPISLPGVGSSLVLGILVTLAASASPALQAGRITPLTAIRWTGLRETEQQQGIRVLLALGASAAIIAFLFTPGQGPVIQIGGMAAGPTVPEGWDQGIRALKGLGILLLFPLYIYASRAAVPIVVAIAEPLLWLRILGGRGVSSMALNSLTRERARASVTVAGFIISLSVVVALFDSTSSFDEAGRKWARSLFPGEFVVVSPVSQPAELVEEFKNVPGVEQVSMISTTPVVSAGLALTAVGIEPDHYFQAFEFIQGERTNAFRQLQRGGAALLPLRMAQARHLNVGDHVRLDAGGRSTELTVAGIVAHSLPTTDNFGAVIITRRDMEGLVGAEGFRFLAISAIPGTNLATLEPELAKTAELFGMESNAVTSLEGLIGRGISSLFGLLLGLVLVGVVVGVISVVTTMLMAITQRQREIGILRAEGMTRRGIQVLFVVEAALMGLTGAVLGILLGLILTKSLIDLTRGPDFDPRFYVSVPVIIAVLLFAVISAGLAAFYPAGVAAKVNIVDAISRQ